MLLLLLLLLLLLGNSFSLPNCDNQLRFCCWWSLATCQLFTTSVSENAPDSLKSQKTNLLKVSVDGWVHNNKIELLLLLQAPMRIYWIKTSVVCLFFSFFFLFFSILVNELRSWDACCQLHHTWCFRGNDVRGTWTTEGRNEAPVTHVKTG